MFQLYSYFFFITTGIISFFSYIFCVYFADFSIIQLPFTPNKIKFDSNKKNKIKFNNKQTNIKNKLSCNKNIISPPKYFYYSQGNEIFNNKQTINTQCIINSINFNDDISKSVTKAFINNKKILYQLEQILNNFDLENDSHNLLEILCNYNYPVNIIMQFCNINEKHMFYLQKNNIIKISNTHTYDKICNFTFNSQMFVIKDTNNTYISNGFLKNFKINNNIIQNIFKKYYNTKYCNQLNKYNSLVIIIWASTTHTQ